MIVIHGRQIRAARGLLGWTQEELSRKARVALGTVIRMESFDGPPGARMDTVRSIVTVLERAGVEFSDEGKPGVRLNLERLQERVKPPAGRAAPKMPRR